MKRASIGVVLVCIAVLIWIASQFMSINLRGETTVITEEPTAVPSSEPYTYSLIRVSSASAITLIPNFSEKRDAKSLADDNGCRSAINGGFYDASEKPLGFFFTDNQTLGRYIQSRLVNGYFFATTDGVAHISTELPTVSFQFALQTGPLLVFGGKSMPLSIQNDEPARRMVVAKTINNQIIFFTVYNGNSVYEGPLLGDLPDIVSNISSKENLDIVDAINFDGGSASAFYSGEANLSELTPVGSIFCIK
jgi:uncharacterized protein YigE (DUF2233 family)